MKAVIWTSVFQVLVMLSGFWVLSWLVELCSWVDLGKYSKASRTTRGINLMEYVKM